MRFNRKIIVKTNVFNLKKRNQCNKRTFLPSETDKFGIEIFVKLFFILFLFMQNYSN